jgi:hypothetical protein
MHKLILSLLRIDEGEVAFSRRGFVCEKPEVRDRLEHVGHTFLQGYHSALAVGDGPEELAALGERLDRSGPEFLGFAWEGAAMSLALQDSLGLRGRRFSRFLAGPGRRHAYMLHVGYGWACARLPWLRRRLEASLTHLDPVLRWLAVDGYGFHEGYFHADAQPGQRAGRASLSDQGRHIFFQGVGRSLWFAHGANAGRIAAAIAALAPLYHGDAWSGIGLAGAYAGGASPRELADLRRLSGDRAADLAQGAAFAAKARQLAGNPALHTESACAVFCRMSCDDAAALCDQTYQQLRDSHPCAYQRWRESLRKLLMSHTTEYAEQIL